MRVLIVGCGYLGKAVGAALIQRGHSVWGLRRSNAADPELKKLGIVPVQADIRVPETLSSLSLPCDWVIHCVSATGGGTAEYSRIYVEGTRNLLGWLSSNPPVKFVYTSSTSVYAQNDGTMVDEGSQTVPEAPTSRILLQAEELLLSAATWKGFPAVVLRVAGIYGPGRAYWLDRFRSGEASIEGDGARILNMVHRDDVAGAIVAALERGAPGRIYNVVDNEPVTQLALFEWLARRLERALPPQAQAPGAPGKRGTTNKRVSNARLRKELEYELRFPSFREGFGALLNSAGV